MLRATLDDTTKYAVMLHERFALIERTRKILNKKGGEDVEWVATTSDGGIQKVCIKNVISYHKFEDTIIHLFADIWGMKDLIRNYAKSIGKAPVLVKHFVKRDKYLSLCADIENKRKHIKLLPDMKWTRHDPELGTPKFKVPMTSVDRLEIRENEIILTVSTPSNFEIDIQITDKDGNFVAGVLDVVDGSITSWKKLLSEKLDFATVS